MKVYEGEDIFVAITGLLRPSVNRKTGPMVQAWVLPLYDEPGTVVGEERVCGDCPQRWTAGGGCYVIPGQAASAVWRRYVNANIEKVRHKWPLGIRITAYGDPAFVPLEVWDELRRHFLFHTAYTHQWRNLDPAEWGWCMASCENEEEADEAITLGWFPYLVLPDDTAPPDGLKRCPAQRTPGRVTCATCRKCDGLHGGVWATAHGTLAGRFHNPKKEQVS